MIDKKIYMSDKEKYDYVLEYLTDAERGLRNKEYFYVANRLEFARNAALEFAKETPSK